MWFLRPYSNSYVNIATYQTSCLKQSSGQWPHTASQWWAHSRDGSQLQSAGCPLTGWLPERTRKGGKCSKCTIFTTIYMIKNKTNITQKLAPRSNKSFRDRHFSFINQLLIGCSRWPRWLDTSQQRKGFIMEWWEVYKWIAAKFYIWSGW